MRVFFMSFVAIFMFTSISVAQTGEATSAVRAVIVDQLDAFKADDAERAFSHAAPGVQARFPRAEYFMAMVEIGYKPIFAHSNYIFGETDIAGNDIVQEVLHTGPDGRSWRSIYLLGEFTNTEDQTSWKIKGVVMRPDADGAIL